MKNSFCFLLVALVYVAHQDFWNWKKAEPLIFGFLPSVWPITPATRCCAPS